LSTNEFEQVWRERIDWVQGCGLTIAEASAELAVSAVSVYRWEKLHAELPVPGWHHVETFACARGRRAAKVWACQTGCNIKGAVV
jgi:hypothetical protein